MSEAAVEPTEDAVLNGDHARVDDRAAPAADNSMAVAVIPKQRIVATSNVAIWDTAAFDHMGRVGSLMASAQLASPTIYEGVDDIGAKARMVMIANLARECGANPLMFLQGCSIISNKLHLEGKIVAAIITARTGIKLRYRFGVWKDGEITFPENPQDAAFFRDAGDTLAVRVEDPEDPERFVDGYVGLWKTDRKGSPWSAPANWRRQLRYRGAPEWARAYEPGAVLGFYSDADEDLDVIEPVAPRKKRDLTAKLDAGAAAANGAGAADAGFDRQHVADETGEERKDAKVEGAEAETMECAHEFETIEDGERVCKHCGVLAEDVADETPENSQEAGSGGAGADATRPDLDADAAFLADLSGEEEAVVRSRLDAAEKVGDKLAENPQAEAGETYLLAGDEFTGKDKRRVTYKDGVAFSSVGPQGAAKLKVYAIHAEVPEEEEKPAGGPAAEEAGEEAVQEAEAETEAGDTITDMVAAKFGAMTTWPEIKAEWAVMCKTTDWVGASPQDQDAIRRATWPLLAKLSVDQSQDVTAFGVWMPTQKGREGADAIKGTFDVLKRSDVWAKLTDAQVETLEKRVAATISSIGGV